MRTKRLRRWVAGLCAAVALGIGALSAAEIIYAAQDFSWGMTSLTQSFTHRTV
jgi:hypothetical protein